MDYCIRQVRIEDAEQLIKYVDQVLSESDNLTFGKGEFEMPLDKEVAFLQTIVDDENSVMYLAMIGDEIAGQIHYSGGRRKRVRHTGEFGITVRKKYWGEGVGKKLLLSLIEWAKLSPYCEKINLKVRDDNFKAITLYRKCGFKVEGLIKKDMKINGEFVDCLFMGLDIEK